MSDVETEQTKRTPFAGELSDGKKGKQPSIAERAGAFLRGERKKGQHRQEKKVRSRKRPKRSIRVIRRRGLTRRRTELEKNHKGAGTEREREVHSVDPNWKMIRVRSKGGCSYRGVICLID